MKDKITNVIIWLFVILIFASPFLIEYSYVFEDMQINPYDYARITDVDYKAVVVDEEGSRGKVVITERLTFDVHAASKNNLFWELWRDLPEDFVDGVKVSYKVKSVKQILPDGTEIVYEQSPKLYWEDEDYVSADPRYGPGKWYHSKGPYSEEDARYEAVFFYVYGMYREQAVFEIEYEMYNASLKYNDCSDLYLAMYSGSTVNHLKSFKGQILFPEKDMPSPGNYKTYTYGTNNNDFPIMESDTINPGYHTFYFLLNEDDLQFKPYNQYIEFDLVSFGEDKHIFTEYASINEYTYDNVLDEIYDEQAAYANTPGLFKTIKIVVFIVLLAISIGILIYAFTAASRTRSKYIFYKPETDYEYFRDIPSDLDPNFAATLVHCKHKPLKDDSGVYSAILLSLARKEYIELNELPDKDVQITIKRVTRPAPARSPQQPPYQVPGQMSWQTFGQPPVQGYGQIPGQTPVQWYNQAQGHPPMQGYNQMPGQPIMQGYNQIPGQPIVPDVNNPTPVTGMNMDTVTSNPTPDIVEPEDTYEPLTLCEQYYFNLLVRHARGNVINMKRLQTRVSNDYENTDDFVRNMANSIVNIGVGEGYFQKADYTQPRKQLNSKANTFMVWGILFITLVNIISYHTRMDLAFGAYFILGISCIISSLYLKKVSKKFILLSPFGEDEYEKWRGLYDFLNSETLMHERTVIELPLWEKYLVYATAFGISNKVIKAIGIRCPEASSSAILSNNYCRSGRIHHSSRSFRSSVRRGSSVARSGGGGGFGYGGGGRGGGGGGGGH